MLNTMFTPYYLLCTFFYFLPYTDYCLLSTVYRLMGSTTLLLYFSERPLRMCLLFSINFHGESVSHIPKGLHHDHCLPIAKAMVKKYQAHAKQVIFGRTDKN